MFDFAGGFIAVLFSGPILFLVWPVLVGEVPRYLLLTLAAMVEKKVTGRKTDSEGEALQLQPYSAIIVGHNEGESLLRSVKVLEEQLCPPAEVVVVSDGSDDGSQEIINELLRLGKIASAHHVDGRNGKSAALNLGLSAASQELILFIDSDTTLDRKSTKYLLSCMHDKNVGAVSANVIPRGTALKMMHMIQKIEYGITLSLGRLVLDKLGIVSCVSGACGMYRRAALECVSGYNAGSGEDLDLTLRIRQAGWTIRFAHEAVASTAVPLTLSQYTSQRLRWERDGVAIRLSRHRQVLLYGNGGCHRREVVHMAEYLMFYIVPVLVMPFYLIWLYSYEALFATCVLIAVLLCNMALDIFLILVASALGLVRLSFIEFLSVPLYSFFALTYYRPLRLISVASELLAHASDRDNFVPKRVRQSLNQ